MGNSGRVETEPEHLSPDLEPGVCQRVLGRVVGVVGFGCEKGGGVRFGEKEVVPRR